MQIVNNLRLFALFLPFWTRDILGNTTCGFHEITCGDDQCYFIGDKCNGKENCKNGFDEKNCDNLTCPVFWTTCGDGQCYYIGFGCNGRKDCRNGADERRCSVLKRCPIDWLPCGDGQCYFTSKRCDGNSECVNKRDEMNCGPKLVCPRNWINCGDGQCYHRQWSCDNICHCNNGRDEQNCTRRPTRNSTRGTTTICTPVSTTLGNSIITTLGNSIMTTLSTETLPLSTEIINFPQPSGSSGNQNEPSTMEYVLIAGVLVIGIIVAVSVAYYFRQKVMKCASMKSQPENTNGYVSIISTNEPHHNYQGLIKPTDSENRNTDIESSQNDNYDYVQTRAPVVTDGSDGYSLAQNTYTNNTLSRNPTFDTKGYVASI